MKQAAERLLFLLDFAILPEEDIKLNNQTFNWPGRMEPIFEVSQQRLNARREKAEKEVKDRCVWPHQHVYIYMHVSCNCVHTVVQTDENRMNHTTLQACTHVL